MPTPAIESAIRAWLQRIEVHGIGGRARPTDSWGVKIEHFADDDGDCLVAFYIGPECDLPGDTLSLPGTDLDTNTIARLLTQEWPKLSSQHAPTTAYFSRHDSRWVIDLNTGNEIADPW